MRRTDSDGGWGQNLIMSCVRPEARTLGCGKMVGELTEASTAFACCLSPGQYDVFSLSASGKGVGTVEVVSGQDAIYPLAEVTGTGKWDGVTFFVGPTPGPTLRDLTTAPSQTPSLSPTVPTADAGLCLRAVHASELQGGEVDCWTKITDVSTYPLRVRGGGGRGRDAACAVSTSEQLHVRSPRRLPRRAGHDDAYPGAVPAGQWDGLA